MPTRLPSCNGEWFYMSHKIVYFLITNDCYKYLTKPEIDFYRSTSDLHTIKKKTLTSFGSSIISYIFL